MRLGGNAFTDYTGRFTYIILLQSCLCLCCNYLEQKTPCGSTIALLKSQPEVADLLISLFFVAASTPTEKGYVFIEPNLSYVYLWFTLFGFQRFL